MLRSSLLALFIVYFSPKRGLWIGISGQTGVKLKSLYAISKHHIGSSRNWVVKQSLWVLQCHCLHTKTSDVPLRKYQDKSCIRNSWRYSSQFGTRRTRYHSALNLPRYYFRWNPTRCWIFVKYQEVGSGLRYRLESLHAHQNSGVGVLGRGRELPIS